MPLTEHYDLPYPGLGDEPNVPLHLQALAEDTDDALHALAQAIAAGGGNPGTGTPAPGEVIGGTWIATGSGQSIPATRDGNGTTLAFGAQRGTPRGVTRSIDGSGHRFTLSTAGIWSAAVTVRVASSSAAGEISAAIRYGASTPSIVLAHDGGRREGLARTLQLSAARYLPADTRVAVHLYNGTGGTRALEPAGGDWVQLDLWRVG